jgi:hypothetical protein
MAWCYVAVELFGFVQIVGFLQKEIGEIMVMQLKSKQEMQQNLGGAMSLLLSQVKLLNEMIMGRHDQQDRIELCKKIHETTDVIAELER